MRPGLPGLDPIESVGSNAVSLCQASDYPATSSTETDLPPLFLRSGQGEPDLQDLKLGKRGVWIEPALMRRALAPATAVALTVSRVLFRRACVQVTRIHAAAIDEIAHRVATRAPVQHPLARWHRANVQEVRDAMSSWATPEFRKPEATVAISIAPARPEPAFVVAATLDIRPEALGQRNRRGKLV